MNVTELVDRLRSRDVEVIVGRHVDGHDDISLGGVDEVTDKLAYLNGGRDGVFVEASGRVWILGSGNKVSVRVELDDDTITPAQDAAVALLTNIGSPALVIDDDDPVLAVPKPPVKKLTAKKTAAKKR